MSKNDVSKNDVSKNNNFKKNVIDHFSNMSTGNTVILVILVLVLLVLLFFLGKDLYTKHFQKGGFDLTSVDNFVGLTNTPYY